MTVQETKDFLVWLINRELKEEYRYQQDGGDEDKEYLAKLIQAERWVRGKNAKGFDRFIADYIAKEDMEKYLA